MEQKDSMSLDYSKQGHRLQTTMRWLAAAMVLVSLVCALWINFGIRLPIEQADKTIGLLVDYDELKRIADGSRDIQFSDMARKAALAGATGLVVRERILADWENAGEVLVLSGLEMQYQVESWNRAGAVQIRTDPILSEKTYILTKDPQVAEQIFSILEAKRRYPERFSYPSYEGIGVNLSAAERATLGLGFPLTQLEAAAKEGLQIIPRLRNWEPFREDSLSTVFAWVAQVPSIAGVGFNDMTIPGGGVNPVSIDMVALALEALHVPIVSFEFYDQAGLTGLASRLNHHAIRAHAIAENELRRYTDIDDILARYTLAASERNIRYIYIRFYGLENPSASMDSNMDLIHTVKIGLEEEGLLIGKPYPLPAIELPFALSYLLGLGVIAAAGWFFAYGAAPFAKEKWLLPYLAILLLGCMVWTVLLLKAPGMARKLMALAAAILFPSVGVIGVITWDREQKRRRALQATQTQLDEPAPITETDSWDQVFQSVDEQAENDSTETISREIPRASSNAIWIDTVQGTAGSDHAQLSVNARLFGNALLPDEALQEAATAQETAKIAAAQETAKIAAAQETQTSTDTDEDMQDALASKATALLGETSFSSSVFVQALLCFLVMSACSFLGAMILSALLGEKAYMLKLDSFVGVKVAHIVPLMLIPLFLWIRETNWYPKLSAMVNHPISFWQLFAGLVLLTGLAIYVLRTGNDNPGTISSVETMLRQYLDRGLGVRPRTKEFLIGHPIMLMLLYFGYRSSLLPVLILGVIGQISLTNTYAHLHTPLTISFLRSFHGIWLGCIFGFVGIHLFLWIRRSLQVLNRKEVEDGLSS